MATALAAQTPETNAPSQVPPPKPDAPKAVAHNPVASDATPPAPNAEGPDVYKKMSLEQLMNQDVTSVSREPEPLRQAPAAIQIITNDEIRAPAHRAFPKHCG